ncbi:High-affinity nicotinic acid transporter [Mycena kentingensis (nom. inval.)]|nr:High-affinity nicotinic acid transporter [Mycena kentingensis (nom. inval.)]
MGSQKSDEEKATIDLSETHTKSVDEPKLQDAEKKAILRRLDLRLVSVLGLVYCVNLMDRANLSNANIAGMSTELKLDGNKYNIISVLFFPTYVLFQPTATVLVRKIGPRLFLSAVTLCWGVVMIGMGFVKSWNQLAGLRVVLGIFEAASFPSSAYLLSTWYTRYEVGKRNAMFYLISSVSTAFAGILAYGLQQMSGLGGLSGWRWIFIIEGLITTSIAAIGYWLLVDFPDSSRQTWKFLSEDERQYIIAKVQADRGDVKVVPFNLRKYLSVGLDWKIWLYAMIYFNTSTLVYALAVAKSQCLIAPPYVFGGIVTFICGAVGDKYHIRGPIIVFNNLLCVVGIPLIGWTTSPAIRYFGVFLVTAGTAANVPTLLSYQANNIRGQWKRAFASASLIGFGGIGGIAGSLVFRSQDRPEYRPGLAAFYVENRKADRGVKELETSEEDHQPGFRYTY